MFTTMTPFAHLCFNILSCFLCSTATNEGYYLIKLVPLVLRLLLLLPKFPRLWQVLHNSPPRKEASSLLLTLSLIRRAKHQPLHLLQNNLFSPSERKKNYRLLSNFFIQSVRHVTSLAIVLPSVSNALTPPLPPELRTVQQALSALQVTTVDANQWLPDSAASSHMAHNLAVFDEYTLYKSNDIVVVGNGKTLAIDHIGIVTLHISSEPVLLRDALHVAPRKISFMLVSSLQTITAILFLTLRVLL